MHGSRVIEAQELLPWRFPGFFLFSPSLWVLIDEEVILNYFSYKEGIDPESIQTWEITIDAFRGN